ncbi:MAG: D-glycero-beta-D-manno-heptose-7-phosphate kinase [Elusimicrobia bacterium]|nr:D-glycero-beta-D-manno-heptose-7-phosphate kinase [Elusimicrobiota bacterium]
MTDKKDLTEDLNKFKGKNIVVVGDIIVDRYIFGGVKRISPEAPVPVVDIMREEFMPGGAGNVINNIISLGGKAYASGVIGKDSHGRDIVKMLKDEGADTSGIIKDGSRPTSVKTRIIADRQQVVRTDIESKVKISKEITRKILKQLKHILKKADGIIISDYGKGIINRPLIEGIIRLAEEYSLPVVVDPQVGHFLDYSGVTSLTPNEKEVSEALNMRVDDDKSVEKAGFILLQKLNSAAVLITRGSKGMTLFKKGEKSRYIPTAAKDVFDVTGAGDTVTGIYMMGIVSGLGHYRAAQLANYGAAKVISRIGTVAVTVDDIRKEIEQTA